MIIPMPRFVNIPFIISSVSLILNLIFYAHFTIHKQGCFRIPGNSPVTVGKVTATPQNATASSLERMENISRMSAQASAIANTLTIP